MGLEAPKMTNMKDGNVMLSKISSNYISNRAWLRAVVGGREAVLCRVSALEYLEMFVGYIKEKIFRSMRRTSVCPIMLNVVW